jgi:hypothetical protein
MGYFYWYALGILVPYEYTDTPHIPPAPMTLTSLKSTAAGLVIDYWPNNINIAV